MIFHNVIQIAGVIDKDEADMLVDAGVDYLGFPLRLKDGREDLSEEAAAEIIRSLQPPVYGVNITYISFAEEIKQFCDALGAKVIQLHGKVEKNELRKLKIIAPDLGIIKSLIVRGNNIDDLKLQLKEFSPLVDSFITDTFDPATGRSGATGIVHDWNISKTIVELSPKPVILAGGLNPENVSEAIRFVKPAGVDSHTGVESPNGRKDPEMIYKFVSEAKSAFAEILS